MAKFIKLPIDSIDLDYDNPRIAKWLEIYPDKPSAEAIAMALGVHGGVEDSEATTFSSLKNSIKTNKGLIYPIIVNEINKEQYTVIEGNTRLAIYQEFHKNKVEGEWDKIISIVHPNMSQEQIDSIRLQAHLVDPRPWDPYSKAKYLEYLKNSEHFTMNKLIDYCGGSESKVTNYINAYLDMEKYYRPIADNFDHTRFSSFQEIQNPRLREALINDGYSMEYFSKWVNDYRLYPQSNVRQLPNILKDPDSREIFLTYKPARGASTEALRVLAKDTAETDLKKADILELANAIINRSMQLTWQELMSFKKNKEDEGVQVLFQACGQLTDLCEEIDPDY